MPVIINEIQINTTVDNQSSQKAEESSGKGSKKSALSDKERQSIIAACIDEVMRIMQEKQDR